IILRFTILAGSTFLMAARSVTREALMSFMNFSRPASTSKSLQRRRKFAFDLLERRELLSINPPVMSTTPVAPQIFLTPSVLSTLQQEAAANTSQWKSFKANLDKSLAVPIDSGYQASNLQLIDDYALGYQVLKTIAPATAANYADKAI